MARNTPRATLISADSSANTEIPVDVEVTQLGDRDSEAAWDSWIDDLRATENSGTIRAYKLSMAEDGTPNYGKGSKHALLGAWPHQMFDLDSLSEKLRKEFMEPGEVAFFKITGTTQGKSGTMCSQVIKLIRSKVESSSGPENMTQLFQLMQQGQERNLATLREIVRPQDTAPSAPSTTFAQTAIQFATVLAPVLGPVLAALVARPPKPATDFAAMVDAMRSMKGFITGQDEGDSNDTPMVAIIKSVAPALPQLLQTLQANRHHAPAAQAPRIAPSQISAVRQTDVFEPHRIPNPNAPLAQKPLANAPTNHDSQLPAQSMGVDRDMLNILKPQLEQLAEVAASGESPKNTAQLIVQLISSQPEGEKVLDALATLVEDEKKFANLMVLVPKLRAHSAWFEELRKEIANIILEDESEVAED